MPLIRLKQACFLFGRIHEAGETVRMPEGMLGPHKAVQKTLDRIDYDPANGLDANRILGEIVDVPMYDVIEEHKPAEIEKAVKPPPSPSLTTVGPVGPKPPTDDL